VISTSGGSPQFLMFGSTGVPGVYQSLGVSTDASYSGGPGGGATQGLKLTQAWGVRGAFNHNWDPLLVDQPLGQLRAGALRRRRSGHPHRQGDEGTAILFRQLCFPEMIKCAIFCVAAVAAVVSMTSVAMMPTAVQAMDFPFCIKGDFWAGSAGDCTFQTYAQCLATASGRGGIFSLLRSSL
jgi:hypothetical protein